MNIKNEIIRVTLEYFEDNLDYHKLFESSKEYKQLLYDICGEDMDSEKGRVDMEFDNGKALGTLWAALCVDDLVRTRQFVRGINKAIQDKINNKKPLHILYAGTGPFATLILPFLFKYSKEDITYTLVEVNPFSFKILQTVISKLELKEGCVKLVQEDATKYQIDQKNKPDIIISETMQNALAKEQQVSIFLNLMKQVNYESIFIPERIELFIGLKKGGVLEEEIEIKHYKKNKKIFDVSKEAMFTLNRNDSEACSEILFSKKQVIIQKEELKGYSQIVLITEIQVYGSEKISVNQSGLTTPIILKSLSNNLEDSITIDTQYIISAQPKLDYQIT